MTATPWGEAEQLRLRKLTPGPGQGQEAVARSQRERLFAATVAVVANKGYEATRVEDILVMAGVSRNAFYRHFPGKLGCFLATLEALTEFAGPAVLDVFEHTPGTTDRKLAAMLDALAAVIVSQPAVAQVGWVEVYVAGPEAVEVVERLDRTVEDIVCRALRDSPEHADMPREIVRSVVGGIRKLIYTRLRAHRAEELPELMPRLLAWMQGYRAPPERLRCPRRVPPEYATVRADPRDARERILWAVTDLVAEKGYPNVSITEIAARAAVSLTTFYANFDGKEAALLATLAEGEQRVFLGTAPHVVAAPDWATGIAAGLRALLGFLATEPTTAYLGGIGIWATSSPAGLDLRAQGLDRFSAFLDEGFRQYPDTDPVAAEAIGATVDALLFTAIRRNGAERLYEIGPTATFITLAPFVGSERACELANRPLAAIGQTTL